MFNVFKNGVVVVAKNFGSAMILGAGITMGYAVTTAALSSLHSAADGLGRKMKKEKFVEKKVVESTVHATV